MNDHYRMRTKLWSVGVRKGLLTPREAASIEGLWDLEEWTHRGRLQNPELFLSSVSP